MNVGGGSFSWSWDSITGGKLGILNIGLLEDDEDFDEGAVETEFTSGKGAGVGCCRQIDVEKGTGLTGDSI